jgi:hypothetical protein
MEEHLQQGAHLKADPVHVQAQRESRPEVIVRHWLTRPDLYFIKDAPWAVRTVKPLPRELDECWEDSWSRPAPRTAEQWDAQQREDLARIPAIIESRQQTARLLVEEARTNGPWDVRCYMAKTYTKFLQNYAAPGWEEIVFRP